MSNGLGAGIHRPRQVPVLLFDLAAFRLRGLVRYRCSVVGMSNSSSVPAVSTRSGQSSNGGTSVVDFTCVSS